MTAAAGIERFAGNVGDMIVLACAAGIRFIRCVLRDALVAYFDRFGFRSIGLNVACSVG